VDVDETNFSLYRHYNEEFSGFVSDNECQLVQEHARRLHRLTYVKAYHWQVNTVLVVTERFTQG